MYRYGWILFLLLLMMLTLSACQPVMPVEVDTLPPVTTESDNKVLLILRENTSSLDKQLMETDEALVMKLMLEEAGFDVDTASASKGTFLHGEIALDSDMALADVDLEEYVGVAIPCLCTGRYYGKPEEVEIARKIAAAGLPVAAQRKSVHILAEAGALAGKRYSSDSDQRYDPFYKEAIYDGSDFVQDENIITSTYCPGSAPYYNRPDQTVELMQSLIAVLQQ